MMTRFVLGFSLLVLTLLLAAAGCAKKQKPDLDPGLANTVLKTGVEDKDLSFESTGSDSGKIVGLFTVHFDYDRSNLNVNDRALLVKNAQWLKSNSSQSMQIEGHCDRHGSTEYNLALGQRRAESIKSYLVDLGVKADRILTVSYGKEKMLDSSETDEADAKNRRANFKPIEGQKINRMSNL